MNILFVCLGNICRSPLAEAVFADLVRREGLNGSLFVDSAGTAGYHQGELADSRSRACALRHGLEITHRARAVAEADFSRFDLLIAMDEDNVAELRRRAPRALQQKKVHLFREWDPVGSGNIPDPYYGDEGDFELVWHLCDRAALGLMNEIRRKEKL